MSWSIFCYYSKISNTGKLIKKRSLFGPQFGGMEPSGTLCSSIPGWKVEGQVGALEGTKPRGKQFVTTSSCTNPVGPCSLSWDLTHACGYSIGSFYGNCQSPSHCGGHKSQPREMHACFFFMAMTEALDHNSARTSQATTNATSVNRPLVKASLKGGSDVTGNPTALTLMTEVNSNLPRQTRPIY